MMEQPPPAERRHGPERRSNFRRAIDILSPHPLAYSLSCAHGEHGMCATWCATCGAQCGCPCHAEVGPDGDWSRPVI
jgi:hypothetical protein